MITELCMETGWSFRDVMAMPMQAFGMFVGHSRKLNQDRLNSFYAEMTIIAGSGSYTPESRTELAQHYAGRAMTEEQRKKRVNPRLFNAEDRDQSAQAAAILVSAFRMKKKKMGIADGRQ